MIANLKASIAMLLLALLRAMLGNRAQVVVMPTAHSTSPRTARRQLGRLIAKGMTRGIPGGVRLGR